MSAFLTVAAPVARGAEITAIRFGVSSATETRLVFDFNGLTDYELSAAAGSDTLVVKFPVATMSRLVAPLGKGAGRVQKYSVISSPSDLKVELSLSGGARLKSAFIIPPGNGNPNHRVVIDLVNSKSGELSASLPPPKYSDLADVIAAVAPDPSSSAMPPVNRITPQEPILQERPVIVIDAGHGGSDPGAAGPDGAKESAVTLAAAKALAEILEGTGRYDVVLTRSKDTRLAHEERSKIAREAKAGLFISLHADAHSDDKVRGGSVYTLSDEGTERSAREALAQGNYVVHDLDIGETGKEVGGILYNLAQRDTANASDHFAEILIGKLSGATPLLNNTHRRGNFKVLLAPDVPAVLLELAFISNSKDEANLQSPAWRKRSMGAVASAIDAYFQQRGAQMHASNTPAPGAR